MDSVHQHILQYLLICQHVTPRTSLSYRSVKIINKSKSDINWTGKKFPQQKKKYLLQKKKKKIFNESECL